MVLLSKNVIGIFWWATTRELYYIVWFGNKHSCIILFNQIAQTKLRQIGFQLLSTGLICSWNQIDQLENKLFIEMDWILIWFMTPKRKIKQVALAKHITNREMNSNIYGNRHSHFWSSNLSGKCFLLFPDTVTRMAFFLCSSVLPFQFREHH